MSMQSLFVVFASLVNVNEEMRQRRPFGSGQK